ncbi:hypothetical protein Ae201684_015449 [Aphanomyces euteiches]|uniref:mitogen-activated protein kinase kinase n=1 Tax=Aphanomyces euteiches TaxID=100861 RepID=A0A6G0WGR0_9STRA|nr:hypothetical protein Ae201684_015449 [Aphanomyces euteiches]
MSAPPPAPTSSNTQRPKTPKLTIQLSSRDADDGGKPGAFADIRKVQRNETKYQPSRDAVLDVVRGDGPADLARDVGRFKKLGKGAGGTVYLGCFVPTLKLIAIKEVQIFHEEDFQMVTHELHALHDNLLPLEDAATHKSLQYLGKLFHRKIHIGNVHSCRDMVSFYGAYATPERSSVSIAMEYMDAGTLQDFLDKRTPVNEIILRHIAYCTMRALQHMHTRHMVHRDIKPANILINSRGDFKIADFGLAVTLSKSKSYFSEFQGTLMYMSPERITGQNYSYPSDVWAIGITLLALALGSYPINKEEGFFGLEDAIVNEDMPSVPPTMSSECGNFIASLLVKDPEARLTAFQALEHPFLLNYDPCNEEFIKVWALLRVPKQMSSQEIEAMVETILDLDRLSEFDEFIPDHVLRHPQDSTKYQMSMKHLTNLANACGITSDALVDTIKKVEARRAIERTNVKV